MPWDAWALIFLTVSGATVFIICLVEDLRNSGRYEKKPRGRHRRKRNAPKTRQEVDPTWMPTTAWRTATSPTTSRR